MMSFNRRLQRRLFNAWLLWCALQQRLLGRFGEMCCRLLVNASIDGLRGYCLPFVDRDVAIRRVERFLRSRVVGPRLAGARCLRVSRGAASGSDAVKVASVSAVSTAVVASATPVGRTVFDDVDGSGGGGGGGVDPRTPLALGNVSAVAMQSSMARWRDHGDVTASFDTTPVRVVDVDVAFGDDDVVIV
jgi:hypothetical protein